MLFFNHCHSTGHFIELIFQNLDSRVDHGCLTFRKADDVTIVDRRKGTDRTRSGAEFALEFDAGAAAAAHAGWHESCAI